jgi:hypothetical protein
MGYKWALVATLRGFEKGRKEPKMRIEIGSVQVATHMINLPLSQGCCTGSIAGELKKSF